MFCNMFCVFLVCKRLWIEKKVVPLRAEYVENVAKTRFEPYVLTALLYANTCASAHEHYHLWKQNNYK